jgi:hypothetical protein
MTTASRVERDLFLVEDVIGRLAEASMTLEQIEHFERSLHRGHAANLLKVDRIIRQAKEGGVR